MPIRGYSPAEVDKILVEIDKRHQVAWRNTEDYKSSCHRMWASFIAHLEKLRRERGGAKGV